MLDFFQFSTQTRIAGGSPGFLNQAGPELEPFRGLRAGIVTDKVLSDLGFLETLMSSLREAGIEVAAVYDEVPQDSDVSVVEGAAGQFSAAGCNLVTAIGGGSVIDTSKAVNILLTHGGELRDYQGSQVLTRPLLPSVVVPTTVGTGSEVTSVAVIKDLDDERKLTFVDSSLAPTTALLDPELTFALPNRLVATTAMDALTHALEAFIDVLHSPFSDALAVAAASMIRGNLALALAPDGFEEARANLQIASTMAGIAFNHSMVGIVHAMAHSLGSVAGVPHGLANTLMLTEGLRCNLDVAAHRIGEIGVRSGFTERGVNELDTAHLAIDKISEFRAIVSRTAALPTTLKQVGVIAEQLPLLVQRATEDGTLVYNPKFVEADEILQMYEHAMGE